MGAAARGRQQQLAQRTRRAVRTRLAVLRTLLARGRARTCAAQRGCVRRLLGARSARGCVPPLAGPVRRARLALPQRSIALPADVAVLRQHVPPAKRPLKCALLQCALDVPLEATPWSSHCAVQHLRGTPSIRYSAHCEAQHFRDTGSGHLRAHFSSAALESHLQAPLQCPRFKCATQVPPRVRQVRATRCSLQVPLPDSGILIRILGAVYRIP